MKFWLALSFTDPTHLVPLARRAEELGFEGVFPADHLCYPKGFTSKYPYGDAGDAPFDPTTPFPDCWAAISAMAAVTERLRFSVGIYILPLHDPLMVAKAAATASVLSGGRVALGAGAGWLAEEFEVRGIEFRSRGRRMDEAIEVLRALWTGEMVEYHGRHFDFPPLCQRPAPAAPIPIWIGGASPAALRRAARLGDGWLGAGNDPDGAAALLDELARLRREAGRESRPFEAVVPLAGEPDADVYARLQERGMTAGTCWPPAFGLGVAQPSLEQELGFLDAFGENVIRRFG